MRQTRMAQGMAVVAMAGAVLPVASCNVVVGLNSYYDCPGDSRCAKDATCHDGIKDGDETDVDCGGPCPACAAGKACTMATDCASGACVQGKCPATSCTDGVKDDGESDVDCGGPCPPCADGKGCATGTDCVDLVCMGGSCHAPTCTDGVKNGTETDVDCGGGSCPPCLYGKTCNQSSDCKSMVCMGTCQATCSDGQKDGSETDVDCGGTCSPCADMGACTAGTDCESGICQSSKCTPIEAWAKSYDDPTNPGYIQYATVSTDSANDVLFTGIYQGDVDFGGGLLSGQGGFYTKLDASGNLIWSYSSFADVIASTLDPQGNTYLGGTYASAVNWGPGCNLTTTASAAAYVVKLDQSGQLVWCHSWTMTSGEAAVTGMTLDNAGNVIVEGLLGGSMIIAGNTYTGSSLDDRFMAKMDPSGNDVWGKFFASSGISSVAADGAGNVVVAGIFDAAITFGGPTLTPTTGSPSMCLAKLDSSGNYLWSQAGGDNVHSPAALAVDSANNIYVTTGFAGTMKLGNTSLKATGAGMDVLVAKLDPSGSVTWAKNFGDQWDQFGTGVALDSKGQPVVLGGYYATVNFGGSTFTSAGGQNFANVFLAKFDAKGNHLWSRGFSGSAADSPGLLTVDSTGAAIVSGTFNGTLNFGPTAQTALTNPTTGSSDLFIAKLRTP